MLTKLTGLFVLAAAIQSQARVGNELDTPLWARDLQTNNGNGACKGSSKDYQMNLVCKPNGQSPGTNENNGRRIFTACDLPKKGGRQTTKILLYNADTSAECNGSGGFEIVDYDGTDGEASFCLPDPFPETDSMEEFEEAAYAIFARLLGKGGSDADIGLCAEDEDGVEYCNLTTLTVEAKKKFSDVSEYLLTVCVDGSRAGLFDDELENEYWKYDAQNGVKVAQLRFCSFSTTSKGPGSKSC